MPERQIPDNNLCAHDVVAQRRYTAGDDTHEPGAENQFYGTAYKK